MARVWNAERTAIFAASVGTMQTVRQDRVARSVDAFVTTLWRKSEVWRARTIRRLRHVKDLPDGSQLADLQQTHSARFAPIRSGFGSSTTIDDDANTDTYRLFTTILIPTKPARSSWPLRMALGDRSRLR